jgi:hypothetical protein
MKNEKAPESGVIAVFVEGLQDTPGWIALSRKKQDALLDHTSHIQQNRQLQMLGQFGELMELHQVQELLEGEEMKMSDYMHRLYPDRSSRTIERKRDVFGQIIANIPYDKLKRLTALGTEVLSRFQRIAHAALGDIRNAVRELPASIEADPAKYLEKLDAKLLENRQKKRKGITLHRDKDSADIFATNSLINYLRGSGPNETSTERRHRLKRIVGWTMEGLAVTGTVTAVRVPIPDGVLIRRGRPRKHKKEAA